MSKRWKWLGILLAFFVIAAACSSDGGGDGDGDAADGDGDGDMVSLTVVTPFPFASGFYQVYAADANGYFADEGIEVTIEPLDGSGATISAVEGGSADVGIPSPGPIMQAVEEGAEIVSIFTGYQSGIFTLVVPEGSEVTSPADLAGTTVGVGALDGGEVPVVRAILSEAGLEEGVDYELLAVGDGGTAGPGLQGGDVAAYGAAFIDVLILDATGVPTVDITGEGLGDTDEHFVVSVDNFENADWIEGFGRALARASAWGPDNFDGVLEISCSVFVEECEDMEFIEAALADVIGFKELPASADGQWGLTDVESLQAFADSLFEQGELTEEADVEAIFRNDFVAGYNDFDPNDL